MRNIGLLFGSFDPIHYGHVAIARSALTQGCDEVWLVVQKTNTYKSQEHLAPFSDRLAMAQLAILSLDKAKIVQSSYDLVKTVVKLHKEHSGTQFTLLMGQDLVNTLPQWPDQETVLNNYPILAYPRITDLDSRPFNHPQVQQLKTKRVNVSSGIVRRAVAAGQPIDDMVPGAVAEYIQKYNIYTSSLRSKATKDLT